MLDTVLNIGLNDASVEGVAPATDNPRFAWDSYRRFVQMFGSVSCGVPGERFEHAIDEVKAARGVMLDTELDVDVLQELTASSKSLYEFPQDPRGWRSLRYSTPGRALAVTAAAPASR